MSDLLFVIDGSEYPAPTLDTFDMDERVVLFELANVREEELLREPDESVEDHLVRHTKMTRHPGFMMAMMHVAYARGNPGVKRAAVQELIGRTNFWDAIAKWGDALEGDDANPPALGSTSEQEKASPTSTGSESTSSGPSSADGSEPPASDPASTGTTPSDTSATSVRSPSVA